MGAAPVEHALGPPRVQHAEAPRLRQRAQALDGLVLHHARSGQHHGPLGPIDRVDHLVVDGTGRRNRAGPEDAGARLLEDVRQLVGDVQGQIRSSRRSASGTQLGDRFSVKACQPSTISSPAMLASMAIRS